MPLPVHLKEIAAEMETSSEELQAYINRKTGELLSIPVNFELSIGTVTTSSPDWQREMAEDSKRVHDSPDFVALPSQDEIHEYAIMERFCLSVDNEQHRERLLDAISGKGAFRRFKDLAHSLGIIQDWYRYREEAIKKIAAEFLEAEGIAYVDDSPSRGP